ncbi:MAG TPA: MTH938/NDUFAF3 family protein [Candidatus Limnocylindrales bacterium]|jgi:hypothetical protein
MRATMIAFGVVEVEGRRYDHDIVIDRGQVRKRRKGPSKALRSEYGHTPLTAAEAIPWGGKRLIIGTGHQGQLPVAADVLATAEGRGVTVTAVPTAEACELLAGIADGDVRAVLHVTC